MHYAIPNLLRWVLGGVVFLFATGRLSAIALSVPCGEGTQVYARSATAPYKYSSFTAAGKGSVRIAQVFGTSRFDVYPSATLLSGKHMDLGVPFVPTCKVLVFADGIQIASATTASAWDSPPTVEGAAGLLSVASARNVQFVVRTYLMTPSSSMLPVGDRLIATMGFNLWLGPEVLTATPSDKTFAGQGSSGTGGPSGNYKFTNPYNTPVTLTFGSNGEFGSKLVPAGGTVAGTLNGGMTGVGSIPVRASTGPGVGIKDGVPVDSDFSTSWDVGSVPVAVPVGNVGGTSTALGGSPDGITPGGAGASPIVPDKPVVDADNKNVNWSKDVAEDTNNQVQAIRESAQAIVGAIQAQGKAEPGEPGSVDLTPITMRQDADKVIQEKNRDNLQKIVDHQEANKSVVEAAKNALDDKPDAQSFSAGGASAKSDVSGAVGASPVTAPPSATVVAPNMVLSSSLISVNLDPWSYSGMRPVTNWVQRALAWILAIGFLIFCGNEVGKRIRVLMTAPQAKGNTVALGTGGQVTTFVCAGMITVLVIGCITALMQMMAGVWLPYVSFVAAGISNELYVSWYVMNGVLPIPSIIAVSIAMAGLPLVLDAILAGAMAAIRWVGL